MGPSALSRAAGVSRPTVWRANQTATFQAAVTDRQRGKRDKARQIKELASAKLLESVEKADPGSDVDREFIGRALAISVKTLETVGETDVDTVTEADRQRFGRMVRRMVRAAVRSAVLNPAGAARYLERSAQKATNPPNPEP